MTIIKPDLSTLHNEIKQIYYKYFYKNYDYFLKTSVLFTNVYKIILENRELFDFLEKINQYEDIDDIQITCKELVKYKFTFTNLEEKYIKPFAIIVLLLEKFEEKESFFNGFDEYKLNTNLELLVDMYKEKNYNLKLEDEFNKYNLVEINKYRKLHWQDTRIIDKEYQITFDVKYIERKLYFKILHLSQVYDFKFSFYPHCLNIKNYVDDTYMIFDSKDYGREYNIDDIKKINLRENIKFSDYKVENKLYVKLAENELTFEEIQKNPNFFDEIDVIYTKVVHLIFCIKDEILYIEHIDLEYIFYSMEEYIERFEKDNFKQKGNRYKRQKIFKIDNAKINLIENIYDLVYNSLDNKSLIDEYFEMLNIS
ncbi:hypothetical protein ACN9J5_03680 [Aliarcobacter butzleri]|uniref:hypothetical protein n=1 Tax=Aliarcobacter butzleri TaxID=28197 RepID=UPI003B223444